MQIVFSNMKPVLICQYQNPTDVSLYNINRLVIDKIMEFCEYLK